MAGVSFKTDRSESERVNKLLIKLNEGTDPNPNGGISFTDPKYQDLFFLLADAIAYPNSITRNDASAISYRSFLDLRKDGPVSGKKLIAEIAKRISILESSPRQRYTMWTKCRLRQMAFERNFRFEVEGVTIKTAHYLPKWLQLDSYFISGVGHIDPNVLPFFGFLIFSIEARNENEASEKIFSAADLFFAVANTCQRTVAIWTQRVPSAILWLGPHQFFFRNRTFIGRDRVWYNQNYSEDSWNRFPKDAKEFKRRVPFIRRVIRNLTGYPLKAPIKSSLLLINEGMTSDDLGFRLMRFWSAAEALYAPDDDKTSARKLISRITSFSNTDEWLDKIKLERCYHIRNMYVHKGSRDGDDESLVQHLREMLLHQIYYFLLKGKDIMSHLDLLMMVDLPSAESVLERKRLAIDRRINIARTGRHYSATVTTTPD